ncbi:MAG: hypothetical protein CME88_03935 [Hirschia sp.]|nr:hypothetical protein [Hirschia sp.]MBF17508.1 hypothetical protein [Hirschia sp.]
MIRQILTSTALATAVLIGGCATASSPDNAPMADAKSMSAETKSEVNHLNTLVSILIDAEALYKEAAMVPDEDARVPESLKALAASRANYREQLQERVIALGGEPDTSGEAIGTAHRAFMEARTVVDDDTETAVEETIRGEKYIIKQVKKQLDENPSAQTRTILNSLLGQLNADLASLKKLDAEV